MTTLEIRVRRSAALVLAVTLAVLASAAFSLAQPAQRPGPQAPASPATAAPEATRPAVEAAMPKTEVPPVVRRHEVSVDGRPLRYTVTTGYMPLRSATGEIDAQVFFMAYTLDRTGPAAARPLMFSFNGGPGSSSVWLHMGALGPRRTKMAPDGALPPPPYVLEDNPHTWLAFTDLVFIDPVGTGYSRAASQEAGRKYWTLNGDIESVGEFIRLYLTRYERWLSPLFLVGESYGTTRAAGLAGHLANRGIALNGIVLVSSILQFQTARFTAGNDLPYPLFLPTYAAIAWYHRKLPADLLAQPVAKVLDEVKRWAITDYTVALAQGDGLTPAERRATAERLSRYTGLDVGYLELADLRPEIQRFCRELLREEGLTVGRLDGRFAGRGGKGTDATPEFDPSMTAIRPPYTATFAHYVRAELGFESDATYHVLGGGIGPWDHQSNNAFAETADALRAAFAKNPYMQVLVASGYYDLATPFFATEYTLAHMGLDPEARAQVRVTEYEAGHMMYIHEPSLARFTSDAAAFVRAATAPAAPRPVGGPRR